MRLNLFQRVCRFPTPLPLALFLLATAGPHTDAAPSIVATDPPAAAMAVAPSTPLVITFSAAMDTNATWVEFLLGGVDTSVSWSADHRQLTNAPNPAFPPEQVVVWLVHGRDALGNDLGGITSAGFQTGPDGPAILAISPARGATGISPAAPIIVTFSRVMDPAATSVELMDAGSFPPVTLNATVSWNADKTQMTNTPARPFPGNTMISWEVRGQDALGNPLGGLLMGSYTTAVGGTGVAPKILSSVPVDGATKVLPMAPVVFTFSVPMDTNSTRAQFSAFADPDPALPVTVSWSADLTRMTNTPAPSFGDDVVVVWSATGQDLSGAALPKTMGQFSTASQAPVVLATVPAANATGVDPQAPFVVTFSKAMDKAETTAEFFNPNVVPPVALPTTASWSSDGTQMTNTPSPAFPGNTKIVWQVDGQDTAGTPLEATASGFFTTASGGSGAPPTIVSTVPVNLSSNVAPAAPIIFTFSASMKTNTTSVEFMDTSDPNLSLTVTTSWNSARTILTNIPSPAFPAGKLIIWSAAGEDLAGTALPDASGAFSTASSGPQHDIPSIMLLSRGESAEQVESESFENISHEFLALGLTTPGNGFTVAAPGTAQNHFLGNAGWPDSLEFADTDSSASTFGAKYPAGGYSVNFATLAGQSTASVAVGDTQLPAGPRVEWETLPHVVLGQPWTMRWDLPAGGAAVDYVRLAIEKNGAIIFATPLPGVTGALNSRSNIVVVPATVFTNTGPAEVSLSAFSVTALDTNAIPGLALHAARHRTTTFELRVVDGSVPPPVLLTTNMADVPIGEQFLNPLFTAHAVRPLRFDLVSGTLPPGLSVEPGGAISGLANSQGTFDATLRVTDLLGRSSTQPLRVTTVPLPPNSGAPRLANAEVSADSTLVFDVIGAAGAQCLVERSTDLRTWSPLLTTNIASGNVTLRLPVDRQGGFFRMRRPGLALPAANPVTVSPVLNNNAVAFAQLDELGGTLRLTNQAAYTFTLTVPVGALDRPETIAMTDVAQLGGLPLSGGLRAAVKLQPEGLLFHLPARLDITAPGDLDPATLLAFGARPDGTGFGLQPAAASNRTVSVDLWHFSIQGFGAGTGSDIGGGAPDDPLASFDQEVARELQACKANPNCEISDKDPQLIELYLQMADQVVLPKLQKALSDESALDDAIRTWLKWLKDMALLGISDEPNFGVPGGPANTFGGSKSGEISKRVRRAGSLVAQAIRHGIAESCQRCLQHEIFRIYRMIDLQYLAQVLGLDYDQDVLACERKCLVFEVEIESEITGSRVGLSYKTQSKAKAKLRPQTLGDSSAGGTDFARELLYFTGAGQWNITQVTLSDVQGCSDIIEPASGRLELPWVKIDLYKTRRVYVPGELAPRTIHTFDPDMRLTMRSGLEYMPKEHVTRICRRPAPAINLFEQDFELLHLDEAESSTGTAGQVTRGYRITGFTPAGAGDVILSKAYSRTVNTLTENTLVELRHTPQ